MLKRLIPLAAAAAMTLTLSVTAVAAPSPAKFACGDITNGGGQLINESNPATAAFDFNFGIETGCQLWRLHDLHACTSTTTSLGAERRSTEFATLTAKGASRTAEGLGQVAFFAPDFTTDDSVWLWGSAGEPRDATFDTAPDPDDPDGGALCVEVSAYAPAGGKFR